MVFNLNKVSVAYKKDTPVLKEISLEIKVGEKVGLVGPSGAGKTTLLNKFYELEKKGGALVHQHYGLVPQLSVFHNVYIGRLEKHSSGYNLLNLIRPQKKEIQQMFPILRDLGIEEFLDQRAGSLSGGQQQRVAIARALYKIKDTSSLFHNSVFLGDEPVAAIDPHRAGNILKLVMKEVPTVVVSLHSIHYSLEFCKRIIGLREGEIFFDLPVQQVTEKILAKLYQPLSQKKQQPS